MKTGNRKMGKCERKGRKRRENGKLNVKRTNKVPTQGAKLSQ
jgi:hypothetical protein